MGHARVAKRGKKDGRRIIAKYEDQPLGWLRSDKATIAKTMKTRKTERKRKIKSYPQRELREVMMEDYVTPLPNSRKR